MFRWRTSVLRYTRQPAGGGSWRGSALIVLRGLYCPARDARPLFGIHATVAAAAVTAPAGGSSRLPTRGANFIDITTCPGRRREWRNKTPKAPFESQNISYVFVYQ